MGAIIGDEWWHGSFQMHRGPRGLDVCMSGSQAEEHRVHHVLAHRGLLLSHMRTLSRACTSAWQLQTSSTPCSKYIPRYTCRSLLLGFKNILGKLLGGKTAQTVFSPGPSMHWPDPQLADAHTGR
eukprot:1152779-Pelagomonas_calceolata.AAC.3